MNDLSKNVKNWVVIQHSGAKDYITEHQANLIINGQATGAKGFKNFETGAWTAYSSISDIMSIEEFYRKYPDQVPEFRKVTEVDEVKPMTEEQVKNMQRGLLKGLRKYIDEELANGNKPKVAIEIYNNKIAKIKHSNQISSAL